MAGPLPRTVAGGGVPAGYRHVATSSKPGSPLLPLLVLPKAPQPTGLFWILPHGLSNFPDSLLAPQED